MLQWVLFMVVYKICCQNGRLPRTSALFMDSPAFTCPFVCQILKSQKFQLYAFKTRALPSEHKICCITNLLFLSYFVNTYCGKYMQPQQNTFHNSLSSKVQILQSDDTSNDAYAISIILDIIEEYGLLFGFYIDANGNTSTCSPTILKTWL